MEISTQGNPEEGLDYRRRYRGLIGVDSKVPIRDRAILSLVYTPGVAEACLAISDDPLASFDLTCRGNTVAILTDGSDIFGRAAAVRPRRPSRSPRRKSVIFKTFAGVDAFPICARHPRSRRDRRDRASRSPRRSARSASTTSPTPRAFTVADHLEKAVDIPVFSNQHHGTAILVLGGLLNALKVVGKQLEEISVVISGAGVAGIGVARLLTRAGVKRLVVCDRAGAIYKLPPGADELGEGLRGQGDEPRRPPRLAGGHAQGARMSSSASRRATSSPKR